MICIHFVYFYTVFKCKCTSHLNYKMFTVVKSVNIIYEYMSYTRVDKLVVINIMIKKHKPLLNHF